MQLFHHAEHEVQTAVDGEREADAAVLSAGAFVRQIQLYHRWDPSAWCSSANLDCVTYYTFFWTFPLNQHDAIMPEVEAIR